MVGGGLLGLDGMEEEGGVEGVVRGRGGGEARSMFVDRISSVMGGMTKVDKLTGSRFVPWESKRRLPTTVQLFGQPN